MIVYVDGACSNVAKGQRQGSWGIYWRHNSVINSSGLCKYPPFTNSRAEAEALLWVLVSHRNSNYYKQPLIAASDSAYVVNTMNQYRATWLWYPIPYRPGEMAVVNQSGNEVNCSDLWEKIITEWDQLVVHIVHVRRMFNNGCLLYTSPSPRD